LQEMHTREVELPANRRAIPCMWVFKRKLNADGNIECYTSRLVIKGFHQQHLVDYDKVFAPVVRAKHCPIVLQDRGRSRSCVSHV
jgi:hypothetical protein